ncbi:MAG: hypothetical protein MAGBODY4_01646 [Candidatus Marinimicrobia bacterium]|nr:hypothetical protein [Candidatus Neomarinimicrobiota bacterium]
MIRLILWGVLAYLAYRAYRVVKDSLYIDQDSDIGGDQTDKRFEIDEDDIEDAEFKDLNE